MASSALLTTTLLRPTLLLIAATCCQLCKSLGDGKKTEHTQRTHPGVNKALNMNERLLSERTQHISTEQTHVQHL